MARPANSIERIPELTEIQKAWLAGFLDGEGHFGVQRTANRPNGRRYYVPILQVSQAGETGMTLIRQIQADLGGIGTLQSRSQYPSYKNPAYRNFKDATTLMLYGRMVPVLCQQLLPYLRLKRPQAEILVSWPYRTVRSRGYGRGTFKDPEGEALQISLFDQLRVMNHRGLTEPTPPARLPGA